MKIFPAGGGPPLRSQKKGGGGGGGAPPPPLRIVKKRVVGGGGGTPPLRIIKKGVVGVDRIASEKAPILDERLSESNILGVFVHDRRKPVHFVHFLTKH